MSWAFASHYRILKKSHTKCKTNIVWLKWPCVSECHMLKLPLTRLYSGPKKHLAKFIPKSGSGFHYIYGGLTVRCKGLSVSAADYFVFASRRGRKVI